MKNLTCSPEITNPSRGSTLNSQTILSDHPRSQLFEDLPDNISCPPHVSHVCSDGGLVEVLTEVADHRELLSDSIEPAVVVERVAGAVAVCDVVGLIVGLVDREVPVAAVVAVVVVVVIVVVLQRVVVGIVTVGPAIEYS